MSFKLGDLEKKMGEEEEGVGTNRNQYLDALATELDITCWLPEATRSSPTPPSGNDIIQFKCPQT